MTECTQRPIRFPVCKRRKVEARCGGGAVTSDGGVVLLRQADRRRPGRRPSRGELHTRCGQSVASAGVWVGVGV